MGIFTSPVDSLQEKLEEEYNNLLSNTKKPIILLLGATGVGKSSLLNLVFGSDLAVVGTGKPVTEYLKKYEDPNVPIVLYDTPGYEVGTDQQSEFMSKIVNFATQYDGKSIEQQIHLIWYCIQAAGHRVTDLDKKVLKQCVAANKPVAVIFTKCDLVTEEELVALCDEVKTVVGVAVFRISTQLPEMNYIDLQALCDWSLAKLPASLRQAFIRAQKADVEMKRRQAGEIILQHCAGAALIGASPLPFSDAPLLLANQSALFARIIYLYDMQWLNKHLTTLVGGLGLGRLISTSAAYIVGELVKLIPSAGSAAGAVISGAVAVAITSSLGFTISEVCYTMTKMAIAGQDLQLKEYVANLESIFTETFKQRYRTGHN